MSANVLLTSLNNDTPIAINWEHVQFVEERTSLDMGTGERTFSHSLVSFAQGHYSSISVRERVEEIWKKLRVL